MYKRCRAKNTWRNTTAGVSEGLTAEKKEEKTEKKRMDTLIEKGVPVQQGDGQDGVLRDVTFHKMLGSTSTG